MKRRMAYVKVDDLVASSWQHKPITKLGISCAVGVLQVSSKDVDKGVMVLSCDRRDCSNSNAGDDHRGWERYLHKHNYCSK